MATKAKSESTPKSAPAPAPATAHPSPLAATFAKAVKLVDSGKHAEAVKALKSHPTSGSLHYLKAVAFAQAENVEASAESLKKAMELDADLVFQWHMEPDFNPIRKSPLFAFTEGR